VARAQDDVETMRLLIERGANTNATNAQGDSPLHVSCRNDDSDGISQLLESSADPALQNEEGESALHVVAAQSNPDRVQLLLDAGHIGHTWCTYPDANFMRKSGRSEHGSPA
jgi:ankyrin repeat protein